MEDRLREIFESWATENNLNTLRYQGNSWYVYRETESCWQAVKHCISVTSMKYAIHKILGLVCITPECEALQSVSNDPQTMFVVHEGKVLEVTANLVTMVPSQYV